MSDVIENKVAKSGLITLDLEEVKPAWDLVELDIAPWLWQGLALKEKDFRTLVSEFDWTAFQGKYVAVHCSVDAIIPLWAWMLIASKLRPHAHYVMKGSRQQLETALWRDFVHNLDLDAYEDKRVILKGCSKEQIDDSIYAELTFRLQPVVKSLMFGEPCSTVPVYKK